MSGAWVRVPGSARRSLPRAQGCPVTQGLAGAPRVLPSARRREPPVSRREGSVAAAARAQLQVPRVPGSEPRFSTALGRAAAQAAGQAPGRLLSRRRASRQRLSRQRLPVSFAGGGGCRGRSGGGAAALGCPGSSSSAGKCCLCASVCAGLCAWLSGSEAALGVCGGIQHLGAARVSLALQQVVEESEEEARGPSSQERARREEGEQKSGRRRRREEKGTLGTGTSL